MTAETAGASRTAEDMRREFDAAFAAPPRVLGEGGEALITLRVAGQALAVRKSHIAGVARCKSILPLPTHVPGLLGITALRGTLLPAYDLASLLGLPAPAAEGAWLILTGAETPLALIFEKFEGQVEIDGACLYENANSREHERLRVLAPIGDAHRAVIDIPGIVAEIRKAAGLPEPAKE